MYKVTFTMRDCDVIGEEKHEFCFMSEKDANTFYEDLENFIELSFEGKCYVTSKSSPEKMNDIIIHGYDPYLKKLYRVD